MNDSEPSFYYLLNRSLKIAMIKHLISKWQPINYCFVCMLITPLRLVNMFKKQKNLNLSENGAKRANLHVNKRIIYWPPFWNKVYACFTPQLKDMRYINSRLVILDCGMLCCMKSALISNIGTFKCHLKTHLFSIYFS